MMNAGIFEPAGVPSGLHVERGETLLLSRGVIHPKFRRDSSNRRHRNAVGVNKDGQVVFVCIQAGQEKYATLHELAEFFLQLGCGDALFLDGDLSTMVVSPEGQIADKNEFGAILAVTEDISSQPNTPPTRDAAGAAPR